MKTVALTLVLLLLAGRASAQQGPPSDPGEFLTWALTVRVQDTRWGGFTMCGTYPTSWINHEALDPDDVGMVQAHEQAHREFMQSFGSCYAWHMWHWGSRAADVETEARAFCAGALYDYRKGRFSWMEAMYKGAQMFSGYYRDPEWDVDAALQAILKYCTP